MIRCTSRLVSTLLICLFSAYGQSKDDKEGIVIVEIGAAPSWNLPGFSSSLSPTVAVEFTPIEHWLEIEIGTTPTFTSGSRTWVTDLLFKKPWTLSRKVEFMLGAGPEWIHIWNDNTTTNSVGIEAALDFMFWPNPKRRWGWYLEPTLDHNFGPGYRSSLGMSGGLLIKLH